MHRFSKKYFDMQKGNTIMRNTRKLLSLLLATVMLLALSVPAFAANDGKITVDNAVVDKTYTIYELLYLESYDASKNAYAYKATTEWAGFVASESIKGVYVNIDAQGYATWVTGADAAAFAEAAKKYAEDNNIGNQGTTKATTSTVEFTGLELGYYLVVSDLGALCSLDTTNPTVTIKEKNGVPTVKKEVEEDSDKKWYDHNDGDIGQTVNFKATINVIDGDPKDYVLHDEMSKGLTFNSTSVKVTVNGTEITSGYALVTENLTDNCTFEVRFANGTLKPNDVVVVTYSATINNQAVVGLPGNPNKVTLSYEDHNNPTGDDGVTPPSETITYTWDMDVLKYANGVESNVLAGVKFVLLKKVDNVEYFAVVDENGKITGWTTDGVAPETGADEEKTYASVLTTNASGKIEIDGLDADTYYLREIEALPGYNVLAGDEQVVIEGATKANDSDDLTYTTEIVKINNQSGTELPSTGGMGTTLFYVLGGVLVAAAAVLLITRKRMNANG